MREEERERSVEGKNPKSFLSNTIKCLIKNHKVFSSHNNCLVYAYIVFIESFYPKLDLWIKNQKII